MKPTYETHKPLIRAGQGGVSKLYLCETGSRPDPPLTYSVPTKALNQAVKRNAERFPEDLMFRLSRTETL